MGWASGSSLADDVWDAIKSHIPKPAHKKVAQAIVDAFEGYDCDTMAETQLWDILFKRCPTCKGDGSLGDTLDGGVKVCKKCDGEGTIKR